MIKMPIGGEENGNFLSVKGENCTFLHIRGVRTLLDETGQDMLKLLKRQGGSVNGDVEVTMTNILKRLDAIEQYLQTIPNLASLKSEKGEKGDKGDRGEKGEQGEQGPPGIQGPRGKGGRIDILEDVNLDGLDDGSMLVYSAKQKKWVVSNEE